MNDAEQYAMRRMDAMTKAIMGHLRPTTLDRMLRDLDDIKAPPPEDVVRFMACAARQASVLS